ncbi:substrate-binding domain-containing protein [uncultured Bacteroides sp.]|uniref:PstS family phosphate ABC transporter substrate-binding protein n=1 Tax=uncultured Bacteroides sp. TaxID=162156 RepID=UPI0025EAB746|nr:substrate-binding domain-containing protein [uncultured Bacteroides sp.]
MKSIHLFRILFFAFCALYFCSCSKDEAPVNNTNRIKGLTVDNFPIIDSSTSTHPLMNILAYKLLGIPYYWQISPINGIEMHVVVDYGKISNLNELDKINMKLNSSTTHQAFVNLIDSKVELIISSRNISRDEKLYAETKNVVLIERPVGLDGFVFIKNKENPVKSLTSEQIKAIYTGRITNWREVGGRDVDISPYMRNPNSGSQEKMETLVMEGEAMIDLPEMVGGGMTSPFYSLGEDKNGIAYTPYYYCATMVDDPHIEMFSVNDIQPGKATIISRQYPYVSEIYAAIRTDIDKSSMSWKIFEFITSGEADDIIEESGYIRYR